MSLDHAKTKQPGGENIGMKSLSSTVEERQGNVYRIPFQNHERHHDAIWNPLRELRSWAWAASLVISHHEQQSRQCISTLKPLDLSSADTGSSYKSASFFKRKLNTLHFSELI